MKKRWMILIATAVLFSSCEAVFTYAPLSGLARSPEDMTTDQKIVFAQQALNTNSTENIEVVLTAIDADIQALETTNEQYDDLNQVAVDLSISASGVNDLVVTAFEVYEDFTSRDTTSSTLDIESLIADIPEDISSRSDSMVGYIANLEGIQTSLEPSTDYILSAAVVLIADMKSNSSFNYDNITLDSFSTDAKTLAEGFIQSAITGLEAEGAADHPLFDMLSFLGISETE